MNIDWEAEKAAAAAKERAAYEAREAKWLAMKASKATQERRPEGTGALTGQSCPTCGRLHRTDDDMTIVGGAVFCTVCAKAGEATSQPRRHDIGCASQSGLACDCR